MGKNSPKLGKFGEGNSSGEEGGEGQERGNSGQQKLYNYGDNQTMMGNKAPIGGEKSGNESGGPSLTGAVEAGYVDKQGTRKSKAFKIK